ncbi:unnamed protein product [Rotaria sordida]|uniref:Uncharacterized protein n=1 Tax=Rotaria sordida TaxID=392033 RepID=A0A814UEB3_9BILA|nr:unnamed protein product [Rotaria sordida]CAF1172967.1 unnamed protein product [Rotaria sordida]CAF3676601.1 unnamed protein product [Rotaria sordida]CAF3705978.1 unnamed protein product [Rotaria sordida]
MFHNRSHQVSASANVSHTLQQLSPSNARYAILPSYPTSNNSSEIHLLRANIPIHHLNREEVERRYTQGYHQPTSTRPINDHERRIFFLSRLWNVNKDILEFNFTKFMKLAQLLAANRIHRFSTQPNQEYLHEDDYSFALEFFLQIDIDLFYMKTCSYRGAQPIIDDIPKSLFCINEPQVRYALTQCNQLSCCLCYPWYKLTYRQHHPIVQFGSNQQYTFINGYRSILNCPATCTTRNIIYVLKCPCHQVEYIGETSLSLANRLAYHQEHGNRILQEFLLGKKNTSRIRPELISFETLVKNDMKLYQHSIHCSSAIQWFLDENPEYWPFIPRKISEAEEQEEEKELLCSAKDTDLFHYANDIPIPPCGYRFTLEQKMAIDQFFHEEKYKTTPNLHLDLYQATIVAILPDNASTTLRRWVEALFITHAATKLNTIGHLDQFISTNHIDQISSIECDEWCRNLISRSH